MVVTVSSLLAWGLAVMVGMLGWVSLPAMALAQDNTVDYTQHSAG